ncbi:FAD/FMN-containing isoamyl alcohol oxidase MreA [Wilcoxina mikolae CBS 423.85]|nr:FAD/FMN-containing isoamyl alcohol oxidase MreA [Wilcoxina mikolae CBS 423.85]
MVLSSILLILSSLLRLAATTNNCRVFPGDKSWPTKRDWTTLNKTVSGRLIGTIPIGSPCHDPNYHAEKCLFLQKNWRDPGLQYIIPPPPLHVRAYSINVSHPTHISAAIRFAKIHNIRLVIRNTGNDYLGKSIGAGGIQYIPSYSGAHPWRGTAFKLGAGVQGVEAFRAADGEGKVVVGGECGSVGIAEGYMQGGGHSALNSRYGMAADQVLELEVVTADGGVRIANPKRNPELYWALCGGGGGTYGVAVSMTVKAYDDEVTSVAKVSWIHDGSVEQVKRYWDSVDFFHHQSIGYTNRGVMSVNVYFSGSFSLSPFFAPGLTKGETTALLNPLVTKLQELQLNHTVNITEYPGYLPAFLGGFDAIQVGIVQYGSRLIPRKTVLNDRKRLQKTIRRIIDNGSLIFEVMTHPSREIAGFPENAVLPAWRDNQLNLVVTIPWNDTASRSDIVKDQHTVTDIWGAALRELAPDSGVYMNEADPFEPRWQREFFGRNCERLRGLIRRVYFELRQV